MSSISWHCGLHSMICFVKLACAIQFEIRVHHPEVHLIFIREQNTTASIYIFVTIQYRVLKPFGFEISLRLWNQTMSKLLERGQSGARIDRIVWVVNAAWQRATEVRNRMLQELRICGGKRFLKKNLSCLCCLLAFCSLFWMWKGEIAKMLHDDRHKLCIYQIIHSNSEHIIYKYLFTWNIQELLVSLWFSM